MHLKQIIYIVMKTLENVLKMLLNIFRVIEPDALQLESV